MAALCGLLLTALAVCTTAITVKKTTKNDWCIQSTYLVTCVAPEGPLGGRGDVPSGMPYSLVRKQRAGLIVDQDGWGKGAARKAGDFTLPGTEEEGFTVEYTVGTSVRARSNNLRSRLTQVAYQSITSTETTADVGRVRHVGQTAEKLKVDTLVYIPETAKYVAFHVTLTNAGTSTLKKVYYLRNVDPDQDADIAVSRTHTTINQIQKTFAAGDTLALVTAQGPRTGIWVGYLSTDTRAIVSTGGFSERSASKILGSSTYLKNKGQKRTADQAISIIINVGDLAPGKTADMEFDYVMTDDLDRTVDAASHLKVCHAAPKEPEHGSYDHTKCKDVDKGDSCTLTCDGGFTPSGPAICEDTDKWASPLPTCVPAACKLPFPALSGGMTADCKAGSSTSVAHETTCATTCPTGTVPSGDLECIYGEWTEPDCHPPHVYLPDAFGLWEFDNKSDAAGHFPDMVLSGGATVDGALHLSTATSTNVAYIKNNYTFGPKSMIAWVQLDDLNQKAGVMSIDQNYATSGAYSAKNYDGIDYNELWSNTKTFHPHSESSKRSPTSQLVTTPETSTTKFEAIAISWWPNGTVQMFKDGAPYGAPYTKAAPPSFTGDSSRLLFGKMSNTAPSLKGAIDLACFFDEALTPAQQDLAYTSRCRATARDCVTPPIKPAHGTYSSCKDVEHDKNCTLRCETGYTKTGDAKCENGKWIYPPSPACAPAGCTSAPPAVTDALAWPASCSKGVAHGAECPMTCKKGFYASENATCSLGRWSVGDCVDVCTGYVCPDHPESCREFVCDSDSMTCLTIVSSNNTDCGFEGVCRGGSCIAPLVNCTCNARVADGFSCGAPVCRTTGGRLLSSIITSSGFDPEVDFGPGTYEVHEGDKKAYTKDGKWMCTWE